MQLTENQQNLAKAYGKCVLNKELYNRGVIPKALYAAAAEKLILEIDHLNNLCYYEITRFAQPSEALSPQTACGSYNDSTIHTKAV